MLPQYLTVLTHTHTHTHTLHVASLLFKGLKNVLTAFADSRHHFLWGVTYTFKVKSLWQAEGEVVPVDYVLFRSGPGTVSSVVSLLMVKYTFNLSNWAYTHIYLSSFYLSISPQIEMFGIWCNDISVSICTPLLSVNTFLSVTLSPKPAGSY